MLVLNPSLVVFGATRLEGVLALAVDREAERLVVEWGDAGPHAVFADVPEQRVTVRVEQRVDAPTAAAPTPGAMAALSWTAGGNASDASRTRSTAQAVATRVTHRIRPDGAVRTIEFVLVSASGAADPIATLAVGSAP